MGHFTSWSDFLRMGGYAIYVWPAYVAVIVILLLNGLSNTRRLRHLLQRMKRDHRSQSKRYVDKT